MSATPGGLTPPAVDDRAPRPGLRGSAIMAAAWVAAHLPEPPLAAAADAAGELWYRTAPSKRLQARANLLRVCVGLAASGRGPARARRAATDPDALERIVRASFRHAARYYLEVLRTGAYDVDSALARIDVETPVAVRDALQSGRPVIIVGMHFGAIELPVTVMSSYVGHSVTAPMETVADPGLAHWFRSSRSRVGINIVPIRDARRALLGAIRRGESVGLVADRDLTHNGIPVPFFGHPTPIAAGPALLALETGVPIYATSARRLKGGRYAAKLILVPEPAEGKRRERVTAYTAAIAEAFETILADAPEQWWAAFHPIWPDLAVGADDAGEPAERA
jgi:phosphatidylinositol dimannoside acyltransferase